MWLRELRPREVNRLAQNNTDGLWQSWPWNTGLLIPNAVLYLLVKHTASLMPVCKEISGCGQRNATIIMLKHGALSTLAMTEIHDRSSRDGSPDVSYILFSGKTRLGQGPSEGNLEVG